MKVLCSCWLGFQLLNLRILAITLVLLIAPPAWAEAVKIGESTDYPPTSPSPLSKEGLQGGAWVAQQSSSQVTAVQLQQTEKGLEIILETADGKSLQVFPTSFSKTFVANIPNAQLAEGKTFRQENPISGIASIAVTQQGTKSIRVTVTGTRDLPKVDVGRGDRALTLSLIPAIAPTAQQPALTPPTTETETAPKPTPQQDKLPPTQGQPEQPVVTSPGDEEQEIVVTGEQEGYSVPDASTATRTDTPLRDIPQSIQVVPRQVIEDQQITRISDAVRNVSGVTVQREYGDYSYHFTLSMLQIVKGISSK